MLRARPLTLKRARMEAATDIGRRNRQVVLREIVLSGPVSRAEVASRVGLTFSAVSRIVRPLIDSGLVRELPGEQRERPGRRAVPLEIDPGGGQVLGIGIGSTFTTVTLADIGRGFVAATELALETLDDSDAVVRTVARESRRLIGAHLEDRGRLLGGLLMVAGGVDPLRGEVLGSPCEGWGSFPLRAKFADFLDLPITVQPMVATLARAETLFGETKGRDNVVTVLCGLNVSAALIVDGRLVESNRFPADSLGHMELTGEDGHGTLNQMAGGLGVLQRLHGCDMVPARVPRPRMGRLLREAIGRDRADDPEVAALMARAGRELGRIMVQCSHLVMPEAIVIAGPLAMAPSYVAAASDAVAEGKLPGPVEVVASAIRGPVKDRSASCEMAIWEYLVERPLDLTSLPAPAH